MKKHALSKSLRQFFGKLVSNRSKASAPKNPPPVWKEIRGVETLESRIAPALVVAAPMSDIVAAKGQTHTTIDLSKVFENASLNGMLVRVDTNFAPATGTNPGNHFFAELNNDTAPLTVANFLNYALGTSQNHGTYKNTFFHRAAFNGNTPFVLQGGGYTVAGRQIVHIPEDAPVHNEFHDSNVRGTLAMAKVGGDPNSATSEWFVNLSNNSSNLNTQNGGFTVFGHVLGNGMNVVDAISNLPHVNLGGALSDVPVQNYSASANAGVMVQNLVFIKNTSVVPFLPKTQGGSSLIGLSVQTDRPDLVSFNVAQNLGIAWNPAKSGVAHVTVKAEDLSDTTHATVVQTGFDVTVEPNLVTQFQSVTFQKNFHPGGTAVGKVRVLNTGAAAANGNVDVKYYFSTDATLNEATDTLVGDFKNVRLNLASGKAALLGNRLTIPASLSANATSYHIFAKVTPSAGSTIGTEMFTDDNVSQSPGTVVLQPNLTASVVSDSFLSAVVPGDVGIAKVRVQNAGAQAVSGNVDIQFYLSQDGNLSDGTGDYLIGTLGNQHIAFSGGDAKTFTARLGVPLDLSVPQGFQYQLMAKVTPSSGNTISEFSTSDNAAASANTHLLFDAFGAFNGRNNVTLRFINADHELVTLTLAKGGFGQIFPASSGGSVDLQTHATTAASFLQVKVKGGDGIVPMGTVVLSSGTSDDHSGLGAADLGAVQLLTSLSAPNGIKALTLGQDSHGSISIGAFKSNDTAQPAQKVTLGFGRVHDLTLDSAMPISKLTATEWLDTDTTKDAITAPSVDTLDITGKAGTSRGDFAANVTLSDAQVSVGSFTVAGFLKNATVRTAGNIGGVTLGGMDNSTLFAGADNTVSSAALPSDLSHFKPEVGIGSFLLGDVGGASNSFVNSRVAAPNLGAVFLGGFTDFGGGVHPDNGGKAFGFVADGIGAYSRTTAAGQPLLYRHQSGPATLDAEGDFIVRVV